jgi:hypothetical protein
MSSELVRSIGESKVPDTDFIRSLLNFDLRQILDGCDDRESALYRAAFAELRFRRT